MVAVDDDRRPVAVPPLQPAPGDETRRFQEAALRKQLRRELAARFQSIKQATAAPPV